MILRQALGVATGYALIGHNELQRLVLGLPGLLLRSLVVGVTCMDLAPATLVHQAYCTGDAISVEGDWVVDLVSGVATPSMDDIVVPALDYTRVDVRFSDADGADLRAGVSGLGV